MATPAICIQNLTKDFAVGMRGMKLRAVEDLCLEVGDNEIFGLLGPNGSGKSTTIKIILGLLEASTGNCEIYGKPSKLVDARRSVGFLPEAPYFYRYLTGRELVRYYARICMVARAEIDAAVDSVIKLVGMTEAADRRVGTYSKGMLQRIGLAQSLVHDPQLVILDEPTAGVDPLGSAAIAEIVRELKRRGKTILLSSHLLAQIEGLCDRVAILHRGKLVREGLVDDLVQEKDAESLVVQGLNDEGRAAVEAEIKAQGGRLARVERPRLSLDAYFLKEVHQREIEHVTQQEGGEEL
ncbi:MAG: ABC transporter ATP-binding protein [Puniceicoccaceae bacterium]|nr:ABC transporter ATP-binding protein [Puniceicoccaceae bacterium]RCL32984.1 MAG: ABC transporter ATP-binding protein [Puniceicoccaceae bacterium]|tara:strand:- start:3817 stop:4704 length:888 start_codon:yes stop_codon:yes gene_type:complete